MGWVGTVSRSSHCGQSLRLAGVRDELGSGVQGRGVGVGRLMKGPKHSALPKKKSALQSFAVVLVPCACLFVCFLVSTVLLPELHSIPEALETSHVITGLLGMG